MLRVDLWAITDLHWVPLKPGLATVLNREINIDKIPTLLSPFSRGDIERHALYSTSPPNVLFLPIDGKVCKDWFSFPPSQNLYWVEEWPLRDRALGRSLCRPLTVAAPFSEYGTDTLAAVVENALCDPTDGLDQLLERQVKRLKKAFEAAQKAARDLREKNWEVVEKRWERHEDP